MDDVSIPQNGDAQFNRIVRGYIGNLGDGADLKVKYIQTAILTSKP